MKTARKALMLILCAALLVSATVMGTLAYLTAKSETVTNTFTVGKITIKLWENDFVPATNQLDLNAKVTEEKEYKVVPGGKSPKNPTVTVNAGSEECYVYVTVENNLLLNDGTAVAKLTFANGWTQVQAQDTKTLYRYNTKVTATTDQDLPVFTHVTYDGEKITEANIGQLDNDTIIINAFAHQSANTDQDTADAAAIKWAFPSAT